MSSTTLPALKSKSILLPSTVCFKSLIDGKFLRYQTDEDHRLHGLLQFSGVKITDPLAQFDVIPSVVGGGLVHLKSRYTNKFLVRLSPDHNWITATADEFNEDQANWNCTMFKSSFVDGDSTKIRLFHIQSGHYASAMSGDGASIRIESCLSAGSADIDLTSHDVLIVVDWTSLHKMPKNVAFKGDNGKYLGPFLSNGIHYLQFIYENSSDPKVAHEVTSSPDGTVRIKSKYFGQFWSLGTDDWIVADVDEPAINDASSMFRVHGQDVNVVSLMNLKRTRYSELCTRPHVGNSLLRSLYTFTSKESAFQITDLGP